MLLFRDLTSRGGSHPPCTFHTHDIHILIRLSHNIAADLVWKMRSARKTALANISDKAELARAVETLVHDFVRVATSNQKSVLIPMDAISLINLCRQSSQPFRIAEIWPHIQQIALLPAHDERTTCYLIRSVVSAALEAKDSTTAASIWTFLRSSPHLPLPVTTTSQLLRALCGKPDLVVEMITTLQQETRVRLNAQHFVVAMQALANVPTQTRKMFELALQHNMVCCRRSNPRLLVLFF